MAEALKAQLWGNWTNGPRRLIGSCLAVVGMAGLLVPAAGLAVAVLSQSYKSADQLAVGSLVSLDKNASDVVEAANTDNVDNLFGVVVGQDNALLSLTNGLKSQVQVADSGVVDVIVSDLNGDIVTGDKVTASPLSGVGMKATSNVRVAGVAQGDLAKSAGKSQQTYTDPNGKKQTVHLGVVPVLLNVAYYFKEPEKTIIPAVIQNVANAIAGKTASPLPIVISSGVFLVSLVAIFGLVYSAIRHSIISVGRNPLSQAAVYRSLVQISAPTVTILVASIASVYLILTRL